MHEILKHLWNLGKFGVHVVLHPAILPWLGSFVLALGLRLVWSRQARLIASITLILGFAAMFPQNLANWPISTILRLPGAALILLLFALCEFRLPKRLAHPLLSVILGWWLIGAPLAGQQAIQSVPVDLGIWAGFVAVRRFTRADSGNLGCFAASLALGAALYGTGATPHWAHAAFVVAAVAASLLGLEGVAPVLGRALVVVTAACLSANEHGVVWPIDMSIVAPFLAFIAVSRLKLPGFLLPPVKPPAKTRRPRSRGVTPKPR